MTYRLTITTLLAICAFGAGGVVLAQDEAENPVDDANTVNNVNNVDIDAEFTANDDSEIAPEQPKSEKKPKSKSGKPNKPSSAETPTAPVPDGTIIKPKGLVAAGVDFNSKDKKTPTVNRRVARAELELSAQPVKKVRAEIGIEYNLKKDSLGIVIDKLYAQYNAVDNGSVRVGLFKKSFGLEERAGLDERYFLKRSIVSDGLEDLRFLDHDPTAAYRHDLLNDKLRLTGAFSWSNADTAMYLQNYSAHYRPSEKTELILAGIIRHKTIDDTLLTTFVTALSLKQTAGISVTEAELTMGTNPRIRALEHKTAMLAGFRLQEQLHINIDTKVLRSVVPVAEAAVYTPNIDNDGYFDTQIRVGLTLGFAKNSAFQFRNNFGTIIRKESDQKYRFDSEVVVIF